MRSKFEDFKIKHSEKSLIRWAVVGTTTTAIDYLIFIALYIQRWHPPPEGGHGDISNASGDRFSGFIIIISNLCLRETPAGAFSTDYRCERDRHPPTPPKGGGVSVSLLYCWFERQSRKKE